MKKKVVIIGAGPAGLSTAYELSKSDEYDITIRPANLVPENFDSAEAMLELIEKLQEE